MELTLLIKFVVGLSIVLVILVFLLVISYKNKQAKIAQNTENLEVVEKKERQIAGVLDLPSLAAIVKNTNSSAAELQDALNLVLKYYGRMKPKTAATSHPDSQIYMQILFAMCKHPQTNKNIILDFNRELEKRNPEYRTEINEAVTKGLNSRGV